VALLGSVQNPNKPVWHISRNGSGAEAAPSPKRFSQ
jgi:hypothetical protein